MRPVLFVFLLFLIGACSGEGPDGGDAPKGLAAFEGDWSGELSVGGQRLPLILHVDPDAEAPVTLDSPQQGAAGLVASSFSADEVNFQAEWDQLGASYTGERDGDVMDGTFSQSGLDLELRFERGASTGTNDRARPQEPGEDVPYERREITIEGEPTLAGTLTLPEGEGPFPAVVLVTGSGPQNRDEEVAGHRPFLVLADRLTRAGIAVLRYDDRGVGESGGDFESASIQDLASDAARAVRTLAAMPETGLVGIAGHSEGGLTGALAAAQTDADFLVAMAAPFVPADEVVYRQVEIAQERLGTKPLVRQENMRLQRGILDAALTGQDPAEACAAVEEASAGLPDATRQQALFLCSPGMFSAMRLDPEEVYGAYEGPVLILFGENDEQVDPAQNVRAARAILSRERADIDIIASANHLFQTTTDGSPGRYAEIEETMNEEVPATIAAFIEGVAAP